jgi:cation-transporting ATPase 13A1
MMLTGDAELTALHVAKEVGIFDKAASKKALRLCRDGDKICWKGALSAFAGLSLPFNSPGVAKLSQDYDLISTEAALEAAAEACNGLIWAEVMHIRVLARMSPQGKAKVIHAIQQCDGADGKIKVMMCGDGGNDVGALKQADIGLALLGGYGDVNTSGDVGGITVQGDTDAEAVLNAQKKELDRRAKEANKIVNEKFKLAQKALQARQPEWMQEELAAMQARGQQIGMGSHFIAMKNSMIRLKNELLAEKKRISLEHGNVFDAKSDGQSKAVASMMPGMIRPGDASIAAAFTSRAPSVRHVVDIIRQGRCTLLSALQQQQIMMLECVISAFTLSVLSLQGSRASERQLMARSWLIGTASLSFSYAVPTQKMHPVRPIRSLFHPAIFVSMLGQSAIHLGCMLYAVNLAKGVMGEDGIRQVLDFQRRQKLIRLGQVEATEMEEEADDFLVSPASFLFSNPQAHSYM